MQKKLDTYFNIVSKHDENNKKCFIYVPDERKAYFDFKPDEGDDYIVSKLNIKLYYRKPKNDLNVEIPIINCKYDLPLIKSNLQKAIRRNHNNIAIQSAIVLIQMSPIELLRRLPIIYIEDVCLMDSYPIIVWLMMADKNYDKLTKMDIDTILNVVNALCNCKDYFNYIKNDLSYDFTHENLQFCDGSDELLSLYYRSQYGGLKGDIKMLNVAIDYYKMNPLEIKKTEYNNIDYNSIDNEIEVLIESIDFHCYPQMLTMLNKMTKIDKETIKTFIWVVDSGYNARKLETHLSSFEYERRHEWKKIEKHLDDVRYDLINSVK